MIAKGTTHNNGLKLAQYITTGKDGERAELWKLDGFASPDIKQAFRCVHVMAGATKCEQPFFHVQVRNREGEKLTRQQWEVAAHRIMRMNGLTGQPYAIAFHINEITGEEHMHLAVSRIDAETMKAKPLPFFQERLSKISRELEKEFGLEPVASEREGPIKYAPKRWEEEQAHRLGVDKDAIRNTIRACHDRTDCGRDFDNELANEGLILALGNRRDYVVIDHAGGIHALGQRILGMKPRDLRVKLADLDHANIPSIEQAKEFMLDLPRDRVDKIERELAEVQKQLAAEHEYARRDPVRDEIQWQDALDKAAIAKEEKEWQFVEPKERGKEETRAGREQKQPGGREERHWPINPPQHQSWPGFEKAAGEATRDDRTENLKGPAAQVWTAWQQSDSAQAFAAALDDKEIAFAAVTGEEAYRSHREADFARAVGNYSPRFKDGEIVIVTEPCPEYRREGAIIEPPRIHRLDQSLAAKFVKGLDSRDKLQGIDATLKVSDKRAEQRAADREAIRLDRATDIRDFSREIPGKAIGGIRKTVKLADNVLGGIGAGVHTVTDMFDSLLSVRLTPEQIREGEITQQRREAEGEASIDYSRYTAETTQQRRQQENDREAERHRQRDEERGRDR